MKQVLSVIFAIGAVIAFILLIGAAGAIDNNSISFSDGTKYMVICLGAFALCVVAALGLSNKEQ